MDENTPKHTQIVICNYNSNNNNHHHLGLSTFTICNCTQYRHQCANVDIYMFYLFSNELKFGQICPLVKVLRSPVIIVSAQHQSKRIRLVQMMLNISSSMSNVCQTCSRFSVLVIRKLLLPILYSNHMVTVR